MKPIFLCATVLLTLLISVNANAAIVTFDGLTGADRDLFPSAYVEGSFKVTPVTGRWFEAHGGNTSGNPIPAIGGDTSTASLELTSVTNALFTFSGVDIASYTALTPVQYALEGLLGGITIYSSTGTVPSSNYVSISSPSAAAIDTLRISMVRLNAEGYGLDNISVNAVPEASTLAIYLVSLSAFGLCRARRFGWRERVARQC